MRRFAADAVYTPPSSSTVLHAGTRVGEAFDCSRYIYKTLHYYYTHTSSHIMTPRNGAA